jgi:fucose 4-O-acetylase-like acetyltransferase
VIEDNLSAGEVTRRLFLPKSTLEAWVRAAKAGKLGGTGKDRRAPDRGRGETGHNEIMNIPDLSCRYRDPRVDLVRGFAMFTIVACHVVPGFITTVFYLFNVPMFFIVSGFLHKPDPDRLNYMLKKTAALLIPYAVYLGFFTTLSLINLFVKGQGSHAFKFIVQQLYGGEMLGGIVGPFWFIPCLFFTQQLFNFASNRLPSMGSVLLFAVGLYLIAAVNQIVPYPFGVRFPLSINIVLCSLLFYCIGWLFGRTVITLNSYKLVLILISVMICVLSIVLLKHNYHIEFNMKSCYYGYFILSPVIAISWTILVSFITTQICKLRAICKLLAYGGVASITVLFTHQFLHIRICNNFNLTSVQLWLLACVLFAFCCFLHWLFSKNIVTRAILIGSFADLNTLITCFKTRCWAMRRGPTI